jgi:hypothetical protein
MLTILVLVCSLALTPELTDCNHKNALDVMRVPEASASPIVCAMHGQAYLAETAIGRRLTKDHAVKVICVPMAMVDKSQVKELDLE